MCSHQHRTQEAPEKKFAVKGFNKSFVGCSEQNKLALWNEICLLRSVDHPNVLRVVEVHETANSIYVLTDLYAGGELSKLVEVRNPTRLPVESVLEVLYGVGRGLAALADQHIAHRDLKPSNIMLRKNTNLSAADVVLVDLGMACDLTQHSLIFKRCGTPGYIAPELISRKNSEANFQFTTKVDVFSLGCLAFAMLTGRNPFEAPGRTVDEIIKANCRGHVEYNECVFGQVPSGLRQLVQQMLSVDPALHTSEMG